MKRYIYKILYPLIRLYWFLVRPETQGAKGIIIYSNKLLLIRHTYGNNASWSLPGGKIERGELPAEAMKRELQEEVGLRVKSLSLLGTLENHKEYKRDTVYCYLITPEHERFEIDNTEIAEARWFPYNELPELTSPFTKRVLALWGTLQKTYN